MQRKIIRRHHKLPFAVALFVFLALFSFKRFSTENKILGKVVDSNLRTTSDNDVAKSIGDTSNFTTSEKDFKDDIYLSKVEMSKMNKLKNGNESIVDSNFSETIDNDVAKSNDNFHNSTNSEKSTKNNKDLNEVEQPNPSNLEKTSNVEGDVGESEKKQFKPTSYQLDDLERVLLPHGTFYYGPNSHEIEIPESQKMNHSFNEIQKKLLDDEEIDIVKERERCTRYGFGYDNRKTRRRLFAGIRIANDNILASKIVGTEAFNIFHTVAYEEFTELHNLQPRKLRFNESSYDLFQLMQAHGPKTKVSIDFYTTNITESFGEYGLGVENVQAESITLRWKRNGMEEDDIGIIGDADETFTRDFLRAMQICDVPEFRLGQNCKTKIMASTLVFESSPECLIEGRRWFHPDAILGECVHQIGNSTLHPDGKREYLDHHSMRLEGHAHEEEYSLYEPNPTGSENGTFPLWHAADIRVEFLGGRQVEQIDGNHTGYHFHNLFDTSYDIHFKYFTYIHDDSTAMDKPMWELHGDLALGVTCTHDDRVATIGFNDMKGYKPIFFLNDQEVKSRHQHWIQIVREEEKLWANRTKSLTTVNEYEDKDDDENDYEYEDKDNDENDYEYEDE